MARQSHKMFQRFMYWFRPQQFGQDFIEYSHRESFKTYIYPNLMCIGPCFILITEE